MITHKNVGKITAGFGAAAAALHATPELQADVVNLTFSPGTVFFTSASTLNSISMFSTAGNQKVGGFSVWNDSIGKSFSFNGDMMSSWAIAAAGEQISTGDIGGGTSSGFYFTTGADTTVYIAFKSSTGNIGWVSADLGGTSGDIIFNVEGGQYGTEGESLVVGNSAPPPVPGLGGLAALAVGAAGLRGRRQRATAG
ncbi:MAG: hypothetical protein CMJ34_11305 [Phycisphaerae bacterium]|nr:hypothetical protein [Phycisphaerae bacterium]